MGPNERRLIAVRMGNLAVPAGGGVADALQFLSSRESITAGAREATEWVRAAVAAVRSAPDNTIETDEEICGELLKRVAARDEETRARLRSAEK